MTAVVLGNDPATCGHAYSVTRDGRCHGCGDKHPKTGAARARAAEQARGALELPTYPGLVIEGDRASQAVFSADRHYRYMLARMWDDYSQAEPPLLQEPTRPLMVWVMLNPSTASSSADDPTIRKCCGFAKRLHCGGILVVNLFAWRATDPRALLKVDDPAGPHNMEMLKRALGLPMMIGVAAWGALSPRLHRKGLASMCEARSARSLWSFGVTKAGHPRHPLMLAYDTPLTNVMTGKPWQP